jgi:class 3 adenylate cyclase
VFCLAEGPSREAVEAVHRDAHGLLATTIIEVEPGPVDAFFGSLPSHPVGVPYVESAVRAVLFTDICSSTALTQELGDLAGTDLVREHDVIVRRALEDREGREVKHTGDGIMASFSSVSGAVEAAIAMRSALAQRNEVAAPPLDVRIGISAGEPITQAGDLFGAAVQLAARLCSCSEAGAIAVSVAVRELCIGKQLSFDAGRTITLKGFTEPVTVFTVG